MNTRTVLFMVAGAVAITVIARSHEYPSPAPFSVGLYKFDIAAGALAGLLASKVIR